MANEYINLIGISGRIGSGKDTVGQRICQQLGVEWEIKKFAGKLKQIASILTGIPIQQFEDQEFKKTELPEQWSYLLKTGDAFNVEGFEVFKQRMTVRTLLQRLGTEALRDNLHVNVWTNALFSDHRPAKMSEYKPSKWVITDVRFANEAEAIKQRGGIIIRIDRPELQTKARLHPSETALDRFEFDHTIVNDSDLNALFEKTDDFLKQRGLK
jgi:hypothetical protein